MRRSVHRVRACATEKSVIENWNEVRTAYHVARLGTISGAAEALGLHRATVLRHITQLENQLGEKLFFRHAQGYTPTEAGRELMLAARGAEERFTLLEAQIRAHSAVRSGDLVLTSLPVVAPRLMRAVRAFTAAHPDVNLRHIATARNLKLEKGEAHVAVRGGPITPNAEHVVQPLARFTMGLYGAADYLAERKTPRRRADLAEHVFVAPEIAEPTPTGRMHAAWLDAIRPDAKVVFRSTDLVALEAAIASGVGLGFLPCFAARDRPDLVRVLPEAVARGAELVIVTHMDFHRAPRIQNLIAALKASAPAAFGAGARAAAQAAPA